MSEVVTIEDIRLAEQRVKDVVTRTPMMTCTALNQAAEVADLRMKCEHLQKTGSFKIRGAYNFLAEKKERMRDEEDAPKLVVTHSSGNHAQAVAYGCSLVRFKSHIIVPQGAPGVKVAAILGYGAAISRCENSVPAREAAAAEVIAAHRGSLLLHPNNDPLVIAGQGTIGLEILEDFPDVEAVVVAVGGGGLIGGIATAIKALRPDVHVIGAEPMQVDDAYRSWKTEKLQKNDVGQKSIADALLVDLAPNPFEIITKKVKTIITVSEDEIARAWRLILERTKQLVEPSAAVPLAAICTSEFRNMHFRRVCMVWCGGNLDLHRVDSLVGITEGRKV